MLKIAPGFPAVRARPAAACACWVHPDCGFWMLKRSVVDRKIEALVLGRDKYLGR